MACTTKAICGSKSSPACCRPCSRIGHLYHQFVICPVDRHGPSQICAAGIQHRCGHDGQRKRVAHMPTATATTEDSRSKLIQNHPHDFTKSEKKEDPMDLPRFGGRLTIWFSFGPILLFGP